MSLLERDPAGLSPSSIPPRLFSAIGPGGRALSLDEHRRHYRQPPFSGRAQQGQLVDELTRAGLRGRGGAGFPTGRKLATVAAARQPSVVVVNGCEGEPTSKKDKLLLSGAPHLVVDGALLAAGAVGATEVHLCVERTAGGVAASLRRAIAERGARERSVTVHVATVPARFVAGEETALVHFLNGGEAKPTATPPRPFQRGVGNRPTLVSNAETMAHIAQIAEFGAPWFRELGTEDDPGTALVTLSGALERPGVYEIPLGMGMDRLLGSAGGTTEDVRAVLIGGYFGTWLDRGSAHLTLDRRHLATRGAALGCGSVVALPRSVCGWVETTPVLCWMEEQSAGQCGPCVHGLAAIAGAAVDLSVGRGSPDTVAQLLRWAGQVEGRGACRLPDGAIRFLRSALEVFAEEVQRHPQGWGYSARDHRPLLPIPLGSLSSSTESAWR